MTTRTEKKEMVEALQTAQHSIAVAQSVLSGMPDYGMSTSGNNITLCTGCMFSGKTELLIKHYNEELAAGNAVMAFKPTVDTRGEPKFIKSRTGSSIPAVGFSDWKDLITKALFFCDAHVKDKKVTIFVDEGQFVHGLYAVACGVFSAGGNFWVSGLSGDRFGKPWQPISELLPYCTEIHALTAICDRCGGRAWMTHMEGNAKDLIEIDVGQYHPLCLKCWRWSNSLSVPK